MAAQGDVAGTIDEAKGVPQQWGGLSPHLISRITPCDSKGIVIPNSYVIFAPITEANFDMTLNWQNPFENSGPESKLPSLMAMIQTGQVATVVNAIQANGIFDKDGVIVKKLSSAAESVKGAAKELEGRTGITKLNSRQVFSGMPPIKLSMTLHFRAFADPETEVEKPYKKLLEWALPQELAKDGAIAEGLKNKSFLSAMFPSKDPQMIAFYYANQRYAPMVIEHVAHPLDVPRTSEGLPATRAIQVFLSTLSALDKNDVSNIFRR